MNLALLEIHTGSKARGREAVLMERDLGHVPSIVPIAKTHLHSIQRHCLLHNMHMLVRRGERVMRTERREVVERRGDRREVGGVIYAHERVRLRTKSMFRKIGKEDTLEKEIVWQMRMKEMVYPQRPRHIEMERERLWVFHELASGGMVVPVTVDRK